MHLNSMKNVIEKPSKIIEINARNIHTQALDPSLY